MASLSDAIRAFHSGGLSHNEFFSRIDRALAADHADSTGLLAVLAKEHAKVPLPPDVYAEVRRRIEDLMRPAHRFTADQTRMQTNDSDDSRPERVTSPPSGSIDKPIVELDRMKGIGDTLNGRFLLKECLGFGGMGTVYKALDLRKLEASDRNPYIAIKVLNVQFRGHPKSLIALQREAKKAQALAHPNIVTVYDFDRDGSMVYLTMEYLSGKPLSQTFRTPGFTGMTYAKALPIINGMAKALDYAHERGFVHCDFKPANVFLMDTGQVKVIDFGIARVFQRPDEDGDETIFDAGSLGGLTPAYASPEMFEHREPDPRDDIYALACITYELLTGRHPYGRLPSTQARSAGIRPQRPKNLGQRQWRALKAALSFNRETRTRTVARFLQGMSGERRALKYAALVATGLVIAALFVVALRYYWQASIGSGDAMDASSPPSRDPQTAQPSTPAFSLESITPILSRTPCSAVTASVRGDALQVQGFIGERVGVARLKDELSKVPGVKTVNADIQQVSDEKCAVIELLAPYWISNQQRGRTTSIWTRDPDGELTEGDSLILDIATPPYDSYIYVDYHAFDGGVVHLAPSPRVRGNQAPPNHAATIGELGNWVVAKPFGTDLIALIVTPVPLFDGLRPEVESSADYLRAVDTQLAGIVAKYGREQVAVDFVQITTKAREGR